MATLLDYERLQRKVADLMAENAKLKREIIPHKKDEQRWENIESQPDVGTFSEEKRLRRIIKDWEERYDTLTEILYRQATGEPIGWYEVKNQKITFIQQLKNLWGLK